MQFPSCKGMPMMGTQLIVATTGHGTTSNLCSNAARINPLWEKGRAPTSPRDTGKNNTQLRARSPLGRNKKRHTGKTKSVTGRHDPTQVKIFPLYPRSTVHTTPQPSYILLRERANHNTSPTRSNGPTRAGHTPPYPSYGDTSPPWTQLQICKIRRERRFLAYGGVK